MDEVIEVIAQLVKDNLVKAKTIEDAYERIVAYKQKNIKGVEGADE